MCGPAALAIGAAVVTAAGQGFSAIQSAQQHRYQAAVADQNAKLAAQAAFQEQENTRQAALDFYNKKGQLSGQQRAAMSANGIDINFGSAGQVQADTEMMARSDVGKIYKQGDRAVVARDYEGANYRGEAGAQRSAASGAIVGGLFDIAGTALGTAKQFKPLKAKTGGKSSFG